MKIVIKTSAVLIIILLSFLSSTAQEIEVDAVETPLNKVLISIIDSYNVSISFDDNSLSHYIVTIKNVYPSIDQALAGLLVGTPLSYELIKDVWVIFPTRAVKKPKRKIFLSGRVIDKITNEALPYSHVIVNGWPSVTDLKGSFSSAFPVEDSIITVNISHLGYYILDTIVSSGQTQSFLLTQL